MSVSVLILEGFPVVNIDISSQFLNRSSPHVQCKAQR